LRSKTFLFIKFTEELSHETKGIRYIIRIIKREATNMRINLYLHTHTHTHTQNKLQIRSNACTITATEINCN